ncbi:hypothetical protein BDV12DRAFT_179903, partial [Aspergillus spectabilis]
MAWLQTFTTRILSIWRTSALLCGGEQFQGDGDFHGSRPLEGNMQVSKEPSPIQPPEYQTQHLKGITVLPGREECALIAKDKVCLGRNGSENDLIPRTAKLESSARLDHYHTALRDI